MLSTKACSYAVEYDYLGAITACGTSEAVGEVLDASEREPSRAPGPVAEEGHRRLVLLIQIDGVVAKPVKWSLEVDYTAGERVQQLVAAECRIVEVEDAELSKIRSSVQTASAAPFHFQLDAVRSSRREQCALLGPDGRRIPRTAAATTARFFANAKP